VLQPIIQTIDRFGLKTYHLRKHRAAVDQFCDTVSSREYESEVARAYRKRVEKYRHTLFTFLQYDGVPWNNNNAEDAIKSFVYLRNVIEGTSSEKGMRDYLVLLSISETCKYRGISFLRFLQSQTTNLPAFAETLHGRAGSSDTRRR
jgi:Transposase IS66 family